MSSSKRTLAPKSGYALVIAEKPDAAERIGKALGPCRSENIRGLKVFSVQNGVGRCSYRVCAASGHLYGLESDSSRSVYPAFDISWAPLVNRLRGSKARFFRSFSALKRIQVISELAREAACFIHACDYDLEGETIGSNILHFACNTTNCQAGVFRARFSTLTPEDVRGAFSNLVPLDIPLTAAGRARHVVDFIWGVNVSRAITQSRRAGAKDYRNLTIGRVQTPTLGFVVRRDVEIMSHVPIPYWTISVKLEKDGTIFEIFPEQRRIATEREASGIESTISREKYAHVIAVTKNLKSLAPPFPFNTSRLQSEAHRIFKLPPSLALATAERLYLKALISYPRTDSQKLPPSIGYRKIMDGLERSRDFQSAVREIRSSRRINAPVQGSKDDPAHPAIYPTGILPGQNLSPLEITIYKLVVLQFLAAFAEDALEERTSARFAISDLGFFADGERVVSQGWKKIYPYFSKTDSLLPPLEKGEQLAINYCKLDNKHTAPPQRYDQATLLKKMEAALIGTKATRSQTIALLEQRGYTTASENGQISSTQLALRLIRSLEAHSPDIASESMTRRLEEELDSIASGSQHDSAALADAMVEIVNSLEKIRSARGEIGQDLASTIPFEPIPKKGRRPKSIEIPRIGKCPSCRDGSLRIVVSPKSGKRFIGCTGYYSGCRASAPLPQKGKLKVEGKNCECGWPMLTISYDQTPNWTLCPNPSCPSKLK